jgi:hypothetical protein
VYGTAIQGGDSVKFVVRAMPIVGARDRSLLRGFASRSMSLSFRPDRAKSVKEVVHRACLLDRRSVPSRALATT